MSGTTLRLAGLILLLAALEMACGCPMAPEAPPDKITHNQVRARMRTFAKIHDIIGRAKKGEKSESTWVDLDARKCSSPLHRGDTYELFPHLIWKPSFSYRPHEQYYLVGYYCMECFTWHYLYMTKDRRERSVLGPYSMEMTPTPQEDPRGAGPDPRRNIPD
jgi:hypothetical protein